MFKMLLPLVFNVIDKLFDKYLTAANVEKYSDKLIDICRNAASKIENEDAVELINKLLDTIDEMVGE